MKIIKQGKKLNRNPTYEAICYNCGCVFRYVSVEAVIVGWNQRDGDYHTLNCPDCKKEFTSYNVVEVL